MKKKPKKHSTGDKVKVTRSDKRFGVAKNAETDTSRVHLKKMPARAKGPRPPRQAAAVVPEPVATADREVYHAPSDMRTLTEAQKIKGDPRRHSAAIAHGQTEIGHLKRATSRRGMRVTTSDA